MYARIIQHVHYVLQRLHRLRPLTSVERSQTISCPYYHQHHLYCCQSSINHRIDVTTITIIIIVTITTTTATNINNQLS